LFYLLKIAYIRAKILFDRFSSFSKTLIAQKSAKTADSFFYFALRHFHIGIFSHWHIFFISFCYLKSLFYFCNSLVTNRAELKIKQTMEKFKNILKKNKLLPLPGSFCCL